jgi:hypothetical protein
VLSRSDDDGIALSDFFGRGGVPGVRVGGAEVGEQEGPVVGQGEDVGGALGRDGPC